MSMKSAKESKSRTKRINITMPTGLYELSMSFVDKHHFEGISSLIQHLMREMCDNGSPHFAKKTPQSPSAFNIEAFKKLQDQLQLTPEKAAEWKAAVKDARR
jgi:hypothetical protein